MATNPYILGFQQNAANQLGQTTDPFRQAQVLSDLQSHSTYQPDVLGSSTDVASAARQGQATATPNVTGVRSAINQGSDQYVQGLDAISQGLDKDVANLSGQVDSLYNDHLKQIQTGQENSAGQFNQYRTEAGTNKTSALRDLEANQRSAVQSFGNRLGLAGAGDSSAGVMGTYAYTKLGNDARAKILNNYSTVANNINLKQQEAQRYFDTQMNSLSQWKNQQLLQIQNEISSQKRAIDQEKLTANRDRANQLAQLESQLANYAQSQYANIDTTANQTAAQLDQWHQNVQGRLGQIGSTIGDHLNALGLNPNYDTGNVDTTVQGLNPFVAQQYGPQGSAYAASPLRRTNDQIQF